MEPSPRSKVPQCGSLSCLPLLFTGLLLASGTSQAALISYQISGEVTGIVETAAVTGTVTSISIGDSWSLFATIDTGTADTAGGNPLAGIYPFASMAGNITFDSTLEVPVPASGQSAQVEVRDSSDISIEDRLEFNAFGATPFTIDGLNLGRWDIILEASDDSLFATDALAESIARSLTDFSTRTFTFNLAHPTLAREGATITGSVTAFSATVPLPAAVWLFGSGLLGLVTMARRRQAA